MGILTEPVGPAVDLCAVWLNAGPQRRIGPNRMWVETARRWAALGVPSVRVDLAAIGDADGDSRSCSMCAPTTQMPTWTRCGGAGHAAGAGANAALHPGRAVRGGVLGAAHRAGGCACLGGGGAQPGIRRLRRWAVERDRPEPWARAADCSRARPGRACCAASSRPPRICARCARSSTALARRALRLPRGS